MRCKTAGWNFVIVFAGVGRPLIYLFAAGVRAQPVSAITATNAIAVIISPAFRVVMVTPM